MHTQVVTYSECELCICSDTVAHAYHFNVSELLLDTQQKYPDCLRKRASPSSPWCGHPLGLRVCANLKPEPPAVLALL